MRRRAARLTAWLLSVLSEVRFRHLALLAWSLMTFMGVQQVWEILILLVKTQLLDAADSKVLPWCLGSHKLDRQCFFLSTVSPLVLILPKACFLKTGVRKEEKLPPWARKTHCLKKLLSQLPQLLTQAWMMPASHLGGGGSSFHKNAKGRRAHLSTQMAPHFLS